MKKLLVVLVGVGVFAGEVILIVIILAAITSFFPEDMQPFIPDSSNYVLIAVLYLIRFAALVVAAMMARREIMRVKKDLADVKNYWFVMR